jgi:hypothetical protein
MKLPGKDCLKKAFLVAAAGVGIGALGGCAVVPGPYGRLYVEPVVPAPVYVTPAPVYVEPVYPVYPVYPVHPYHRYGHRW